MHSALRRAAPGQAPGVPLGRDFRTPPSVNQAIATVATVYHGSPILFSYFQLLGETSGNAVNRGNRGNPFALEWG